MHKSDKVCCKLNKVTVLFTISVLTRWQLNTLAEPIKWMLLECISRKWVIVDVKLVCLNLIRIRGHLPVWVQLFKFRLGTRFMEEKSKTCKPGLPAYPPQLPFTDQLTIFTTKPPTLSLGSSYSRLHKFVNTQKKKILLYYRRAPNSWHVTIASTRRQPSFIPTA